MKKNLIIFSVLSLASVGFLFQVVSAQTGAPTPAPGGGATATPPVPSSSGGPSSSPSGSPGPSVRFTSPSNNTIIRNAGTVNLRYDMTGSITHIRIYRRAITIVDKNVNLSGSNWEEYSWNVSGADNGTIQFIVEVSDAAGRVDTSGVTLNIQINRGGDVFGWAWSSNIGWINMNCSQAAPATSPTPTPGTTGCSRSNHKVSVTTTSGDEANITGYAWSSSVGWLSFNGSDLTGCPAGASQAKVNFDTGAVTGWARFLTPVGKTAEQTGTWDGCLELSGPQHASPEASIGTGGVTFDPASGDFHGFAWGGEVIGWVNFYPTNGAPSGGGGGSGGTKNNVSCPNCGGGGGTPPAVSCVAPPYNASYQIALLGPDGTLKQGSMNIGASSVTTSGPGSPYQYSWSNGVGNTSYSNNAGVNLQNLSFPNRDNNPESINYNVTVTAKNSSNNVSEPGLCGYIHQEGGGVPTGDLSLFIGKTASTATQKELVRKPGEMFALKWTVPPRETGFRCTAQIYPAAVTYWNKDSNNTSKIYWDTSLLEDRNVQDKLSTTGVKNGTYTFEISCRDEVNEEPRIMDPVRVDLKIQSVSVIEI